MYIVIAFLIWQSTFCSIIYLKCMPLKQVVAKRNGFSMSLNDYALTIDDLSKCYRIYERPADRLKQMLFPALRQRFLRKKPKQYFSEYWALRNISFTVKKGESIGIIGGNGAGKSTLLQIMCGVLFPTSGEVNVQGKVAALLELGTGFNPEFTGVENVYLYGAVLGMSKEAMDERFDTIAAFADIGDFINTPIKTYSSGMVVRLAFSVVAHVDADILIIDEALAVGDAFFQQKCMRFLRRHRESGGTSLFVTHDTASVMALCSKALLLFPGENKTAIFGESEDLCKRYLEDLYSDPARGKTVTESDTANVDMEEARYRSKSFHGDLNTDTVFAVSAFRKEAECFGERGASIVDAGFFDKQGRRLRSIKGEDIVSFIITAEVHHRIVWPAFGFILKNSRGEYLFTEGTDQHFREQKLVFKANDVVKATFVFAMPHLFRGKYMINVALAEGLGDDHVQHHWIHDAIQIDVLSGRLMHGNCGMSNIQMSIDVHSESA